MATELDPKPQPGEITLPDKALNANDEMRQGLLKAAGVITDTKEPEPSQDTPAPASVAPIAKEPPKQATPEPPKAEPAKEPKEPKGIKEVREALERQTARVKELEGSVSSTSKEKADAYAKLAEFESKISKYESEIEKEYKPRLQRATEAEKKLQQYEEHLRVTNYQKTQEWHDKHVKPMAEAHESANRLMGQLTASVNGQEVPATIDHFNYVLSAPTIKEGDRRARELFGDTFAPHVVNLSMRMAELNAARNKALETAALDAKKWEEQQIASEASYRDQLTQRLMQVADEHLAPFKNIDDPELKSALEEGLKDADEAIRGNPSWDLNQRAAKLGKSRADIATAKVLAKENAKLKAALAEKENLLKQYQSSEPEVVARTTPSKPSGQSVKDKMLADADAFLANNRY